MSLSFIDHVNKKRKNIHDVHLALELVHLGQNLKASLFYEMELFERINIISVTFDFLWKKGEILSFVINKCICKVNLCIYITGNTPLYNGPRYLLISMLAHQ